MPRCVVLECPNFSGRKNSTPGVTFHTFPKDLITIKKWLLQIDQNFGDMETFAQGVLKGKAGVVRICSAHFASKCYHFDGSQKVLLGNAVPTIFPNRKEPWGKVETSAEPKHVKKTLPAEVSVPLAGVLERKEAATTVGSSSAPIYWKLQNSPMLVTPIIQLNMADPVWANNGLTISGLNSWPLNLMANYGPGQEAKADTPTPEDDGDLIETKTESPDESADITSGNTDTPSFLSVEETKVHAHGPGDLGWESPYARSLPAQPPVTTEDKAVQFPEYETRGVAWKVFHDHFYKVRTVFDRQWMKNVPESTYDEGDSEGELLSTLKYVTSVLTKNKERKELKSARLLNQSLEIISLVTGEEWVIVKKDSIHKGIHQLTGEVPVKSGDVGVYFTLDEWRYIERHREEYEDMVEESGPISRTWEARENWDSEESVVWQQEYLEEVEEEPEEPEEDQQGLEDEQEEEEEEEEVKVFSKRKKKNSPDWTPDLECFPLDDDDDEMEEMERCLPVEDKSFPCDKCKEAFSDQTALEAHLEWHEIEFNCDVCGERLASKEDLINHKATNHSNKRYPCPICGIEYEYKSQFIIHQRSHTKEKPFACEECGKDFSYHSDYLVHVRRHAVGKIYECEKCDKRFDKRCDLRKHERAHRPNKRFTCHRCENTFLSKSALMKHKWQHKS